jgi:hypothetical protein
VQDALYKISEGCAISVVHHVWVLRQAIRTRGVSQWSNLVQYPAALEAIDRLCAVGSESGEHVYVMLFVFCFILFCFMKFFSLFFP